MTYEEAQQIAINAGALAPQGMRENMAAGVKKHQDWSFNWAQTPLAQQRLAAWTQGILQGIPPGQLRSRLG